MGTVLNLTLYVFECPGARLGRGGHLEVGRGEGVYMTLLWELEPQQTEACFQGRARPVSCSVLLPWVLSL